MTDTTTSLAPALAEQVEAKAKRIEQIEGIARRIGLYAAVEIGRELSEIKELLPHGAWGDWIRERLSYSQSTATRYMKLFDEYGADQLTILGAVPNSSTLQNISVSNALKLLALPEEERESFAQEHDVEHISAREMDRLIRERDEAIKRAEMSESYIDKCNNQVARSTDEAAAYERKAAKAVKEAEALREELEELKSRPVEVAVQEADPEELEKIRSQEREKYLEAQAALEKKLADAQAKAEKEAAKVKKLKEDAGKVKEQARQELQKDLDAAAAAKQEAEAAKADAEARAKALEDKLKTADGDTAAFQVYFQSIQEQFNKLHGLILKAEPAKAEKYRTALRALLDGIGKML